MFSVHWGENFQKNVPRNTQDFAHALIDMGVDVIHGHSAHHVVNSLLFPIDVIIIKTGQLFSIPAPLES